MEFDALGNARAFCYDPQGSCLNTTEDSLSEDGRVKNPMFYDGYGEQVWPETTYPANQRPMRQPLQYKGQAGYYTDVHTDLCYCINRYYDPRSGRWTMRDPAGLEGGVNVYAYCGGNPVMFWDPSGLDFFDTWFGQLFVWDTWKQGLITSGAALCTVGRNTIVEGVNSAPIFMIVKSPLTTTDGGDYKNRPGFVGSTRCWDLAQYLSPAVAECVLGRLRIPTRGGIRPNVVGAAGEARVKAAVDIGEKRLITINGVKRIPDGISKMAVSEVKNVKYQSLTQQLLDYMEYAKQEGPILRSLCSQDNKAIKAIAEGDQSW